jgi:uncharacterized protein YdaU (DUF1376 family)
MSSKPPAFQFYPQDYLASTRVAEMTLEEEGVYIRLLCYCWSAGSIPKDPERCARLAGKGCSVATATVVQRSFNEHPTDPQRLVHDRLEIERENQRVRREQASSAGKKSAQRRAKQTVDLTAPQEKPAKTLDLNERSTDVQRNVNPSSSSSSSSSIENTHTGETEVSVCAVKTEAAPFRFIASEYIAAFGGTVHITDKRKRAIQTRWKDSWWREHWQRALEVGSQSAFLRGDGGGWKISFDWFLNPDSVAKIIEGNYSGGKSNQQQRKTAAEQREELNASGFEWIRQAAARAAASGGEGGGIPDGTGAALLIEKHGAIDSTCV